MYSSHRGHSRSFSPRGRGPQQGGGRSRRGKLIDPSRYVHTPVEITLQPEYTPQHSFAEFSFDPKLQENIAQCGYTSPTPIQDQAIPVLMEGKDVVGIANTGTGKTAAFLLPFVQKVLADPDQGVLIVSPTRELAFQIRDELFAFARNLPVGIAVCIGGANIHNQIERLRKNPHFVIGTPGRLKDLVERHALDLSQYTNVVLDEVDRMLDIGFRREVKQLIAQLPANRHAAFFSATLDQATTDIMNELMHDPVTVSVKTGNTSENVHQDVVRINPGQSKFEVLYNLLTDPEFSRVIVFGRTKHGINKLEIQLANRGLRVSAIHGNKNQNARQKALDMFKKGQVQALLATDVAARGIDVNDVTHVINFDEPETFEDYVHRIGRTGRAGKIGKALTFVG